MIETVSVIVSTFGDENPFWDEHAKRAIASVHAQTRKADDIQRVHVHGPHNLHISRNRGASMSSGDWLVFLDADDTLKENYIEAMLEYVDRFEGNVDVLVPNVSNVQESGDATDSHEIPEGQHFLLSHSHVVIGAMVRREVFLKSGGFEDWPVFEDWHFWLKCWVNGARFERCQKACYRALTRTGSRNSQQGALRYVMPIRKTIVPLALERGLITQEVANRFMGQPVATW